MTSSNRRSNETITLTGYLGADREICYTRERTIVRRIDNTVAQMEGPEEEFTVGGREYIRLSLATHRYRNGKRSTEWHQLVIWTEGREMQFFNARWARKGMKATVTGRYESYSYRNAEGKLAWCRRFIVATFDFNPNKPPVPATADERQAKLPFEAPAPAPAPTIPSWVPPVPSPAPAPEVPQQPALG